jgi:hypothetical protein
VAVRFCGVPNVVVVTGTGTVVVPAVLVVADAAVVGVVVDEDVEDDVVGGDPDLPPPLPHPVRTAPPRSSVKKSALVVRRVSCLTALVYTA